MRFVFLFVFLLHLAVPGAAAQTSATLTGRVLDASQAAIPGVTITARHVERAIERTTVTGSDGRFVLAYGEIDTASDALGHRMGKNDLWIAATARVLGLTVLTTDKDFDHLHPTWIDREWVDPASKLPP